VPYAVAQARGRLQRDILVEATRGCDSLVEVSLARADALVRKRLTPLES
jgi:kynurenine 3-monooxygenase